MASILSIRLKNKLLNTIKNDLETGTGQVKLTIFDTSNAPLSHSEWTGTVVQSITGGEIILATPNPAQALLDSTAAKATLYNANGDTVYENIPLGTPTQNPNNPIQLNSLVFYAGGTVSILSFKIA